MTDNIIVKAIVAVWKDHVPNGGTPTHDDHVATDTLDALTNCLDDSMPGLASAVEAELRSQFLID